MNKIINKIITLRMRIGQKTTFPRTTFPESDTKYVSHNVSRRITNAHLRACAWARMCIGHKTTFTTFLKSL